MSWAERGGTADERLYARGFVALLVASFIVRFLCSGCVELTGDELMHWQWSRHLALGYPEHPPLIAWTIAGVTRLFGTSERTVRAVPVVAMTAALALAFALGRGMYGARAGFFGATALLITPIATAGGVLATTDALLCCFWTLTVHALKKAVLDHRAAAWPAAGIAAGLALLTKLPALLLFPATAIVLLGTAEGRSQLRRPGPYVAAALALVVFLPALVWNAEHGWVTLVMRLGHRVSPGLTLRPLGELITMQLIAVGPVLFAGFLWALWRCRRRGSDGRAVFLGAFGAVPFLFHAAYSLRASVDPHWPAVGYVTGFIALGAFATRGGAGRPSRALVLAASVPAALLVAVLFVVPLRPGLVTFSWTYSSKFGTGRLADVVEWSRLGEAIAPLAAQEPERTFLLCHDGYAIAGLASFYTPGRPPAFLWASLRRNGAAYDSWKAESGLRGWSAVIIDDRKTPGFLEEVRGSFESVSKPRPVRLEREGRVIRELDVALATGFRGFPIRK